jgi:hypothetical protein
MVTLKRYLANPFYWVVLPLYVVWMLLSIATGLNGLMHTKTAKASTIGIQYSYEYVLVADHTYRFVDTAAQVACYYLDEGDSSKLSCVPLTNRSFIPEGPNP